MSVATPTEAELLESQKQRYDRQIRVWGAEAQSRIQNTRVLICGLSGLHVEVVKNIVLAGMNVVIQDSGDVRVQDLAYNFFVSSDEVGKKTAEVSLHRIQELNSYTTVGIETRKIEDLDDNFFKDFSVILMDDCPEAEAIRINNICRQNSPQSVFFLSGTFGLEGWFISDFGSNFQYKNDPPNNKDIKIMKFPSIETVFKLPWNDMKSRFFDVSSTYVKSRILRKFIALEGKKPVSILGAGSSDKSEPHVELDVVGKLVEFSKMLLKENKVDESFLDGLDIENLRYICDNVNVLSCSVLGSYLAQEVIKGVSLSGAPGFNVFIFNGIDCSVKAIPICPAE